MGTNDNDFYPDEFTVQSDPATGEIRILFQSDQHREFAVVMDQSRLRVLAAALLRQIEHGTLTPISARDLREGRAVRTVSFQGRRNADRSFLLTLGLEIDGRHVTMPVDLDPGSADELRLLLNN